MAKRVKGELVAPKVVKRAPGYLYFLDAEGNVKRTRMKNKRRRSTPKK